MGMGNDILVIKKDELFKDGEFEGFKPISEKDYTEIILKNYEYQKRTEELENNSSWQQPIPYVWIIDPKTKKVFLYKRDITGNEGRLYNKFSGGVGGHIDRETEEFVDNPITSAMMRELKEEVIMTVYPIPEIIGFINLNHDVHAVHFGIVAVAQTERNVEANEDMIFGEFYSSEEIENIFNDPNNTIEEWTKISWPFVKKYIF